MKITAKEYQRRFCKQKQPKEKKWGQFRSGWELEFAQWLTAAGYKWKYEAIRLRLADRTTYTPDFWVPYQNDHLQIERLPGRNKPIWYPRGEFYEVKGYRRQASMIKFKVAKEQFPEFKFYLVTKKNERWVIE